MSVLTSLGILILAVFACAFLQLVPGVFAVFYHYASAKNSRDKALNLSSFFVIGNAVMTTLLLALIYFSLYHFLLDNPMFDITMLYWAIAGILALLGLFVFCFYYRRGKGTELFISRKAAKSILLKARTVRNSSDAFVLGLAAGIFEIIFVLPIYIVVVLEIIGSSVDNLLYAPILLFIFMFFTILPTFSVREQMYRRQKNLADIERSRVKYKMLSYYAWHKLHPARGVYCKF